MTAATSSGDASIKIQELLDQFYGPPAKHANLATFKRAETLPAPYDDLLDHDAHMTVTVEAHHGESVDVVVHRTRRDGDWYSREITLVGSRSGKTVQYGIVRLDTKAIADDVWRRIESEEVPLGRVLIEHNVLREVQRHELWNVIAGRELARLMHCDVGTTLHGRTALIYCDGAPAIELLEIVC